MSDEAAILAAIAAHPDEDTPRLAYADWLDEHGDAAARIRAEFIRVQCAIKQIEDLSSADAQRYANLYLRQNEILEDHRRDLLGPLGAELTYFGMIFDRGFVAQLAIEPEVFSRHADTIAGFKPLPDIEVNNALSGLDDLWESGHPELPTAIHFQSPQSGVQNACDPGTWGTFLYEWGPLDRLRELNVKGAQLGDGGPGGLAQSHDFPALIDLDFSGNEISDDGVQLLVASPLWPQLRRLVLGLNPISDVGAMTLANAAGTSRLEYLNLRFTGIGQASVPALLRNYGGRVDVF